MRIKEREREKYKKKRKLFHTIEFREIIDYFGKGGCRFFSPSFCSILPVGFTYCTTSLHLPNPKLKLLLSIGPNALSTSQIIDYHAVPFSPPGKRNYPLFNSPPPLLHTAAAVIWNNLSRFPPQCIPLL